MTIQWIAFPLHPETPKQGRTLEDLFAGRGVDIPQMLAHLKQTAHELGLPFGHRTMTYNSRRAQELGKWAEAHDRGNAFHHGVFHAYFAKGLNISRMDVLKSVAVAADLDSDAVETVLQQGKYREAVDQDWQRSQQMGISAVPSFHLQGRVMTGAQTYETLEQWIIDAGALPKSQGSES